MVMYAPIAVSVANIAVSEIFCSFVTMCLR